METMNKINNHSNKGTSQFSKDILKEKNTQFYLTVKMKDKPISGMREFFF